MTQADVIVLHEKNCTVCGISKPISDYYIETRKGRKPRTESRCKECKIAGNMKHFNSLCDSAKRKRRARFKNPEYSRNASYKKLYGITLEEVRIMHQDQMGLCANRGCGQVIEVDKILGPHKGKAVVDHCHTTGKVRGLLCFKCNTTLGLMEDKNVVLGLAEYLQKYDQRFVF